MNFTTINAFCPSQLWSSQDQVDNYPSSISCSSCFSSSPCSVCSVWTDIVWQLAEKRRLHATRRSVMTQRRKQKKNNKKKTMSDLSDHESVDGSTAPHSFTAWGRTHQGGSPGDQVSDRASPPVTCQAATGQPVTGQPVASQPGTPVTGQLVTGHPVTGQPVTDQTGTSQLSTGQPGTSRRSFIVDYLSPVAGKYITSQSPVIQSPVIVP